MRAAGCAIRAPAVALGSRTRSRDARLELERTFVYASTHATQARRGRPTRGACRGAAWTGRRRGSSAASLRAPAGSGRTRPLTARGGGRDRCTTGLERRRRRARPAAGPRTPARGGDLRRRRSRDHRPAPRDVADMRDRRSSPPPARARRGVPDPRQPRSTHRDRGLDPHRPTRRTAPTRSVATARRTAFPRICGGCCARRPQRPFRPRVPRPRDGAVDRFATRSARGRHRPPGAAPPRGTHAAGESLAARALLRHVGGAVSPCSPGRAGDCGDPARADRARPGAWGSDGRRPRRARGDEISASLGQAPARVRRASEAWRVPLPRPA